MALIVFGMRVPEKMLKKKCPYYSKEGCCAPEKVTTEDCHTCDLTRASPSREGCRMNDSMRKWLTGYIGECECGCGQITSICPKTSAREGVKKGEHRRFCFGHQNRRFINKPGIEPKRGQFVNHGYVYVIAPEGHPNPTNKRYIKRCRLVAEKTIGRYLTPKEQVHHKNMNRGDDSPENLAVVSLSEHNKLHRKHEKMRIPELVCRRKGVE